MQVTNCRSCGAPIVWVRSVNGVPMPLDADPVPDGNVYVRGGVGHVVAGPMDLLFEADAGTSLYTVHHATCPHGRDWRRRP